MRLVYKPREMNMSSNVLERLKLLRMSIVRNADDGNLDRTELGFRIIQGNKSLTLVFLIKALRATTPPRSPADIPSTSSIMSTVLSVIAIPAELVAW